MSEQTAEATATETEATEQQAEQQPKPAETVDFWKQKAREQEKRAKENAEAAKRLAEIEESQKSQKSEAEKAAERIKQLEVEAEAARRDALRFKVASEFGIAAERAELLLTGSDEETMRRQAEALKGESDERKKQGNRVPSEGKTPAGATTDPAQLFASALSDAVNR